MYRTRINILICFLLVFTAGHAQHLLQTDGKAIVNELQDTVLLRGMGLGGWMLQEGYMLQTASFANSQHLIRGAIEELVGSEATQDFYGAWLENHVQRQDIDSLKSWGFNSVRLPMHYNLFTLPIEEEPMEGQNTWLEKGFELTDSLISWCRDNEMYVILDLHAAPGGQGYDAGISDYDPSKPSLWESELNRNKMASLWKRLAVRYADEQWVAGYDLLNEPNWNLPGGTALRNLYEQVTDSIREVDVDHIIFIEGNWFANDFTGLTPPWDENMVYSPHKYWSTNDIGSMQFALGLRDTHNVPLYLGESGENSNVWFRDAIRLMEDLDIGWAWWPMKKVDDIAGPLSVIKTPEYQYLLNYWNGNASEPDQEYAITALMDLAEGFKIENCRFQKDVIDAMFRQVQSDETVPFTDTLQLPGVIHTSDYDLGVIGAAYYDVQAANYQVSTGEFTEWNTGWSYRNDGVDIETCDDIINCNGYNVGWIGTGEWMKYTIAEAVPGVYDIHLRVASGGTGGHLHIESQGTDITTSMTVPATGAWDQWESIIIEDVIIDSEDLTLTLHADEEGFNVSSMEFILQSAEPSSISSIFLSALTVDELAIEMTTNKHLQATGDISIDQFDIKVNGISRDIINIELNDQDDRKVLFQVAQTLTSLDVILLSYNGNDIVAEDGSLLQHFSNEDVLNTLKYVHPVPGKIEAEEYCSQSGVQTESTTDTGGGDNVGYLDPGDYMDYEINAQDSGRYAVHFRTASQWADGGLTLQVIDDSGDVTDIGQAAFTSTGGWQTWNTFTDSIHLLAGRQTLRLLVTQSPFNLNWMEFQYVEAENSSFTAPYQTVITYPNPAEQSVNIAFSVLLRQNIQISIYDSEGRQMVYKNLTDVFRINETFELVGFSDGLYHVVIITENDDRHVGRFIKMTQ